ncbi:MAG TPA: alginate export family protein, partial [Geobacteraceae bacterium]
MKLQRVFTRTCAVVTMTTALCVAPAAAETGASLQPPPYRLNRADEDYRYLADPAWRTDVWDTIKHVALDEKGTSFLSLGGEVRERFEYFNHPSWGQDPRDHGYFLQRYFLHADLHLGEHTRLFAQLQSSMEDGRRGGPRPTDLDELDVHQLFLDVRAPVTGDSSLTLRTGRQELAYGTQRIISVREGPNVRQSFDGFRLIYRTGGAQLDGFAAKPAQT